MFERGRRIAATRLVDVRAPQVETEGTRSQVLRWLKTSGEPVARDEPLLEVETDKVTVEIASPVAGVLREVLKRAEEEIAPGELLARIEASDAAAAPSPAPAPRRRSERRSETPSRNRTPFAARAREPPRT